MQSSPVTVRSGSNILFRGSWSVLARRPLAFLSVCSGIEAASVAWNPLGWRALGFAEIEPFPSAVLAHHYPDVPNYGDFTKINPARIGPVDILCGGTPCQAFSVAGARRSLDDDRGNLTLAFVDLAHALRPKNVVWENVPGVLSTKDNAFGCFLAGLVGASEPFVPCEPKPNRGKSSRRYGWSAKEQRHYIKWPRSGVVIGRKGRAAWTVKNAEYFSLAQRRERVLVVADFGNGADPAAVLFEPEGMRRDSPPSRKTWEGIAAAVVPSLTASGRGVERTGDTRGQDPVVAYYAPTIARCVATREGSSQDYESTTMVTTHAIQAGALRENPNSGPDGVGIQQDIAYTLEARAEVQAIGVTGLISHALKAEGADASEDGTGRGTPIIAFSAKDYGADASLDLAPTLRAGGHTNSHANAGVMPAVAMSVALRGRDGGATAELGGDIAYALRASEGGGDKPHVLTAAVRRLTPRECERLMGFQFLCSPDYPGAWQDSIGRWWSPDYTAIPYRNGIAADGPRYKVLGNSWAVPKFRWLGERIAKHMPRS